MIYLRMLKNDVICQNKCYNMNKGQGIKMRFPRILFHCEHTVTCNNPLHKIDKSGIMTTAY